MHAFFPEQQQGNCFLFTAADQHHMIKVLRLKEGTVILCTWKHEQYEATIVKLKPMVEAVIDKKLAAKPELPVEITLVMALLPEQKFDIVIQKATELGVKRIIPWQAQRSVVKLKPARLLHRQSRWQNIALQAAKQCKRATVPAILPTIDDLRAVTKINAPLRLWPVTQEVESAQPLALILNQTSLNHVAVIIGPEGGFSQTETDFLLDNKFIPVSFGPTIMRAETAALYALSCLHFASEYQQIKA